MSHSAKDCILQAESKAYPLLCLPYWSECTVNTIQNLSPSFQKEQDRSKTLRTIELHEIPLQHIVKLFEEFDYRLLGTSYCLLWLQFLQYRNTVLYLFIVVSCLMGNNSGGWYRKVKTHENKHSHSFLRVVGGAWWSVMVLKGTVCYVSLCSGLFWTIMTLLWHHCYDITGYIICIAFDDAISHHTECLSGVPIILLLYCIISHHMFTFAMPFYNRTLVVYINLRSSCRYLQFTITFVFSIPRTRQSIGFLPSILPAPWVTMESQESLTAVIRNSRR